MAPTRPPIAPGAAHPRPADRRPTADRPGPEPADDGGFTLLELLLAVAILGLVMTAVSAMLTVALTTDASTVARIDSTRAEQFAATYFADDVQGASPTGGVAVGTTTRCGTEPAVVELRGTSFDPATLAATTTAVAYVLRNATVGGRPATQLHRLACSAPAGSPTPLAPSRDIVVARGLATTAPTVSCTVAAVPAPCTATGVTTVTLTLTPLQGSPFSLVGARRTT